MNGIRILHVIKTLNLGGAEMNLFNLARALDNGRFKIHVAYSGRGELEEKFTKGNIPLFKFDEKPRKLKSPVSLKIIGKLIYYILENDIHIVHTHTFNAHIWGSLAGKFTRRKIVEHVHDSRYQNPHEFQIRGETSRQYRYIKYFRNISDRVIVLTKQNYDFVVNHKINRPEKVFEIQNGICLDKPVTPHEDEKRKLQEKLLIPLDAKVVLAPTRFAQEKNTDLILKIAPRVLKEVKNCIFLVVGDGPLLDQFRKRVQERHLVSYIHTPGFYPDVQELLGITDVFLLPSKLELHSIAILEAMSRRVPVVVSKNVGCNDEFIDDWENGVLRDPFKDEGWAEALIKLFQNETLRRKIGENGYSTCKKKFDIRDIAKKIESLYTELVQR